MSKDPRSSPVKLIDFFHESERIIFEFGPRTTEQCTNEASASSCSEMLRVIKNYASPLCNRQWIQSGVRTVIYIYIYIYIYMNIPCPTWDFRPRHKVHQYVSLHVEFNCLSRKDCLYDTCVIVLPFSRSHPLTVKLVTNVQKFMSLSQEEESKFSRRDEHTNQVKCWETDQEWWYPIRCIYDVTRRCNFFKIFKRITACSMTSPSTITNLYSC